MLLHIIANQITGILLFVASLFLEFIDKKILVSLLYSISTFEAIQEGYCIRTEYKLNFIIRTEY